MEVYFVPNKLPRTMLRGEWKLISSRVREMQSEAKKQAALKTKQLHHSYLKPEQRERLIDELVNPPIILGPYM